MTVLRGRMTGAYRGRLPLAGMTITHTVDDLYQGAVPALIPFLVLERNYSYAAVTGLTLAATVLSSVTQPLFGVLTDRRNLTWLVPAGVLAAGLGVGAAGVVESYLLTWLAIALSGLGVAAYHPEAARAARAAVGSSAGGMSWFALGGNLGFALAPVLATPVLASGGVGATPWLAVPAVVTVLVLVVLRVRASAAAGVPGVGRSGTAVAEPRADDWRSFRWLTGAVITRSICFFAMTSFVALYFTRELGTSAVAGNAALTVFLGSGLIGTLLGGWLADRIGRVRTVRIGYALILPGLGGLLLAPSPVLAYVAAAVLGIALYVPFSVHVTLGQDYLPNRTGTASGVTLGLAVSAGGVVAPALGVLADHAGLPAALTVLLALPLVALAISLRLPETHRRP